MDIGVHAQDLCMHLMDFPMPVRVTGTEKVNFAKGRSIKGAWGDWNRKRYTVEDFASGFVHFDNGATMTLEASWLGHQEEREDMSSRIYGTGGTIQWPDGKYWSTRNGVRYSTQLKVRQDLPKAHTAELHDFYDCVANNKPSPVPWEQTVKVIGILEGIYKSSSTGREVKLKL
jgi:predicted dehydrogenase